MRNEKDEAESEKSSRAGSERAESRIGKLFSRDHGGCCRTKLQQPQADKENMLVKNWDSGYHTTAIGGMTQLFKITFRHRLYFNKIASAEMRITILCCDFEVGISKQPGAWPAALL